MYLALIPDEQSIKYLQWIAPGLPSDVHLTVIHSKADKQDLPFCQAALPLTVPCLRFDVFGFKNKVKVLKLKPTDELLFLRRVAEGTLRAREIKWSNQWGFSPHITLGPLGDSYNERFPPSLTFDRMEWR